MEEKRPVVIQGRTIERERPMERMERARYSYPSRTVVPSGELETYDLSTLREKRGSARAERPQIQFRTGFGGQQPSPRIYSRRTISQGSRPRRREEEVVPQYNSLMIKIGVSVLLAAIIFLLNSIPLPFTQRMVDQVRTALTQEFDVDETLGKLKFVGNDLPEQIKAVFGQEPTSIEFSSPARGALIHSFGEQVILADTGVGYVNQGIDMKTTENANIYASAKAVVAAVKEHETYGLSIWLDHGNQVFTFYGRCGQVDVETGQRVDKGQKLGTVQSPSEGDPLLHFQIWMDGKPTDPLEKITRIGQDSEGRGV